jgi:YD repeat-containing protein
MVYANTGISTSYAFDDAGRLYQTVTTGTTGYTYAYDKASRITDSGMSLQKLTGSSGRLGSQPPDGRPCGPV